MNIAAMNAGLRIAALGSRFLLSLFMARYMRLEDIGTFALMSGVTGLMPSVTGLGLNFFMSRQLVGLDHHEAIDLARERLIVSSIMGCLCAAALALVVHTGLVALPLSIWAAAGILLLENVGLDMQLALLSRGHPMLANVNLLLRTGIWAGPFVALGLLFPQLRSISAIGWFWLGGLIVSHGMMIWRYRHDLIRIFRAGGVWKSTFLTRVGWRAGKIYGSDLGLGGSVYLDRFMITGLAGVRAAGVYFFFASLVNSIYVICLAATVQIYQPQLRAAFNRGGLQELSQAMGPRLRATVRVAGLCLLLAGPAIWVIMMVARKPALREAFDLVPVLLVAYGVKVVSEFFSIGLAAAERDTHYAVYNMVGLGLTVTIGFMTIPLLGFRGAGLALLCASIALLVLRILGWNAYIRSSHPAKSAGSPA